MDKGRSSGHPSQRLRILASSGMSRLDVTTLRMGQVQEGVDRHSSSVQCDADRSGTSNLEEWFHCSHESRCLP